MLVVAPQQSAFEHPIIVVALAVEHPVGIDVEAEGTVAEGGVAHALAHRAAAPVATDTCRTAEDDDGQRLLLGSRRLGHVGSHWSRTETVDLDILTDVLALILLRYFQRHGLHLHGQRLELLLQIVPVRHQVGRFFVAGTKALRCHYVADGLRLARMLLHLHRDGTGAVQCLLQYGEVRRSRQQTELATYLIII